MFSLTNANTVTRFIDLVDFQSKSTLLWDNLNQPLPAINSDS